MIEADGIVRQCLEGKGQFASWTLPLRCNGLRSQRKEEEKEPRAFHELVAGHRPSSTSREPGLPASREKGVDLHARVETVTADERDLQLKVDVLAFASRFASRLRQMSRSSTKQGFLFKIDNPFPEDDRFSDSVEH